MEWTRPIFSTELETIQKSMFALECWCSTAEQGEKLLGLGRITTSGLGSILYGGYALLCAPKFPIIMADGKLPLRDLSTGQIRGHLSVLLAAGTSIQIENLKLMRSDLKQIVLEDQAKSDLLINESLQDLVRNVLLCVIGIQGVTIKSHK